MRQQTPVTFFHTSAIDKVPQGFNIEQLNCNRLFFYKRRKLGNLPVKRVQSNDVTDGFNNLGCQSLNTNH